MESIVLEEMWILFNESSLHLIWGQYTCVRFFDSQQQSLSELYFSHNGVILCFVTLILTVHTDWPRGWNY